MRPQTTPLTNCPNCGAHLADAFCARCGQKVASLNPTLHDLVHDLTHELLHVDGRIFRSVRLLLTRPGFLSREQFAGRRSRYVSPIRLYLIFSVMFFAASACPGRSDRQIVLSIQDVQESRRAAPGSFDAMSPERVREIITTARRTWVPRLMFVLVPVAALFVHLVLRHTGLNYPQHLYFALHVHAACFAVGAVASLVSTSGHRVFARTALGGQVLFALWYAPVAFRVAYAGSWPQAIVRAATVGAAYAVVVLIGLVAVFAAAVVTNAASH